MSEWTRQGLLRPGHWGDPPRIGRQEVHQNPVHTRTSATVLRCVTSPLVVPAASLQQVLALGCVVSWWRGKQEYMFIKLVLFPLFSFSHWVSWVLYFSWALLSSLYNAVTRGSECPSLKAESIIGVLTVCFKQEKWPFPAESLNRETYARKHKHGHIHMHTLQRFVKLNDILFSGHLYPLTSDGLCLKVYILIWKPSTGDSGIILWVYNSNGLCI